MNPLALPFFCSLNMATTPSDDYESHSTLQLLRIMKQRGVPFAAVILFPDHHKAAVKFLRLADKEEEEIKRQAVEEAKYLARLAEIRAKQEAEEAIAKAEILQEIISRSQKAAADQRLKEAEEKARHAEFRAQLKAEAKEAIRKAVAEKAIRESELRAIEQAKKAEEKARDTALQARKEATARSKVSAKVAIPLQPKIKQQPKKAEEQVDQAGIRAKEAQEATPQVAVQTVEKADEAEQKSAKSARRGRRRGGRGRGGQKGRGTNKIPNADTPPLPKIQTTEEAAPAVKVPAKEDVQRPQNRAAKDSKGAAFKDPPLVSHLKTIQKQLGFDDCIHSMLPSKVVSSYVNIKARVMKPEHGELVKIIEEIDRFLDDFVTQEFLRACECVGGPPAWTVREFRKFDLERRAYLERG